MIMPTGTTSSGNVIVKKDVGINPEGRDIIIIEDICDTGNTFKSGRALNRRTLACTRRSGPNAVSSMTSLRGGILFAPRNVHAMQTLTACADRPRAASTFTRSAPTPRLPAHTHFPAIDQCAT